MGVFLYSNRKIDTSKVLDVFKKRGHHEIVNHEGVDFTLVTAPKIIVKNENFLSGNQLGGAELDYAVGIGTYFYKGKYGKDALKLIYDDLDEVLKENTVYGHWAFCIHKNGTTYVFNDMSGFMRLFVYENDGAIIVSSSHTSVLASIENPIIDKARMTGFIAGGYGREEGFVNGVTAIDPLKYVVIEDGKNPVWVNRTIPEVKRIETLDEAVELVSSLFNEQISVLKPAIGSKKIYIDATGGLDSRLISSNLKTAGFDFEFLNYPIFGPDAEIANILSKGLNKKLHVQTNLPAGDNYKEHIGEYDFGNNFYRQYPNPRWELENDFEFSGARGECIDTPDIYSDEDISYMKDPRIVALVPHLCLNAIMTEKGKQEYTEAIVNFFEERLGISRDKRMTEYEQTKFAQFTGGQFGDSNYNSGAQAHCYFYQLYNESMIR